MKLTGLLMMPAGWFIVLAALVLLRTSPAQNLFVAAGMGLEILGLGFLAHSHRGATRGNE